ncbi:putative ABC transport system ATP-binding protein [Hydrogenispora ethanolica]|uniref:Putative ABC transport system ATP-binding protein n=1 Tax=Hydrogenispora ethanolica TaxID=1082276 RepID=A0A4V2QGM5_HYDET|nr:ABC transporter ATP-binding protein [Hydrogenispora ethanolica]TCL76397.1 putative ABC transport system ATP-binding protein [Hydrogenispora ethanolica]
MSVVTAQRVVKNYNQNRMEAPALRGIDFAVDEGEFTSLAGPSGSGKTTLLNLLGCLDQATEGQLFIDNVEVATMDKIQLARLRRDKIGFIFQTYNLIPVLTAYENVELPLVLLKKYPPATIRERVFKILADVGLKGLEHRRPADLSGGQQQRVAIARALVKEPKIILADEPTANLDSENSEAILELMKELNQQRRTTFIFSTHDPLVMKYARRLVSMRDGRIVNDERR